MAFCAENITFAVGQKKLVKNISLSIEPGKLSVILGPNGAGKSTLLKILANELSPSMGKITLDGISLSEICHKKLAKRRAVLPQSSNVTFNFTAFDIVQLGRLPYEEPQVSSKPIVNKVMKLTRTDYLSKRLFSTLSGGEKQRVQFARILAQIWSETPSSDEQKPKYLFLDEPTSALDPLYQMEILNIAKWLSVEKGFGVLAILHDLNQAISFADKVFLLKEGEMEISGSPETVLNKKTIQNVWGINTETVYMKDNKTPVIVPTMISNEVNFV